MSVFVDEKGLTVDADLDRHWRWSDVGYDRDALHVTGVIICREDQLICPLLRPVDHLSQAEFTDERGWLEGDESTRDVDIVHIDVHVWGRVSPNADATETPGNVVDERHFRRMWRQVGTVVRYEVYWLHRRWKIV